MIRDGDVKAARFACDRLMTVHGESRDVDYMLALERVANNLEPDNLDDVQEEDLQAYYDEFLNRERVYGRLVEYVSLRAMAMSKRRQGFVDDAFLLEKRMEEIYDVLPQWAKW